VTLAYFYDGRYTNGYVLLFMAYFSAVLIVNEIKMVDFCKLFMYFMEVLAISSLVLTYLAKPFLGYMGSFVPVVSNSSGFSFYNAHLAYVAVNSSYIRNFGIFREPGIFAIYLCIALIMTITLLNKKYVSRPIAKIVIFIVTIVSTFSTTGYICMLLITLLIGISSSSRKRTRIVFFVVFFAVCGYLIYLNLGYSDVVNPLNKFFNKESSYDYRMDSFFNGLELILEKPFGYGILNGLSIMQNKSSLTSFHNINTFISLAVYLGVAPVIALIYGFYKYIYRLTKQWLLIVPIIILFSSEQLVNNPLTYIIFLYGITKFSLRDNADEL